MFFEDFHQCLGYVPHEVTEPLVRKLHNLNLNDPVVRGRSDVTLAEGKFIPLVYKGQPVNMEWYTMVSPVIAQILGMQADCLHGRVMHKAELSIVPPGGTLKWHHDIYLKDKLCERVHVPLVTSDDVVFYSRWFNDNKVFAYKMGPNAVYRFNNRAPHTVRNGKTVTRVHLLLNYIRSDIFDLVKEEPDQLQALEQSVRMITAMDESWHFNNPKPKNTTAIGNAFPSRPVMTEKQIRLMMQDLNQWDATL